MEKSKQIKNVYYGTNTCELVEGGIVFYSHDSKDKVVGADEMTYDEYIDVQMKSLGKVRIYFLRCYMNCTMGFKGQVEKITKNNICFRQIFVSGMYSDGVMFDGKEDHVWVSKDGFKGFCVGDCASFFAEVYRYVKKSNGKLIDYALRNPENIKKIEPYELPSDDELRLQEIEQIICETCFLSDHCNRMHCILYKSKK